MEGSAYNMRKLAKGDANQTEIVKALRKCGASVWITAQLGDGSPDIVVGIAGVNYLIEIKDGKLPPSRKRLTPDELEFHQDWQGKIDIAETIEEAMSICGLVKG